MLPKDILNDVERLRRWEDDRVVTNLVAAVESLDANGCFVEVGVGTGGTALALAYYAKAFARPLHLFDTFQGMPVPDDRDVVLNRGRKPCSEVRPELTQQMAGRFAATVDEVMSELVAHKLGDFALFHEGPLERTWRDLYGCKKIAFLHIDAFWHQPIWLALLHSQTLLTPGAVVLVSDYDSSISAKAAADEHCRVRGIKPTHCQPGVMWRVV